MSKSNLSKIADAVSNDTPSVPDPIRQPGQQVATFNLISQRCNTAVWPGILSTNGEPVKGKPNLNHSAHDESVRDELARHRRPFTKQSIDDLALKSPLGTLTRPKEPLVSFRPRAFPPYEAKVDKEFVIYVPHSFEELKPAFVSPNIDASGLFQALTGHKVPDSDTQEYEYWSFMRTQVGSAYIAFMKAFGREEILLVRVEGWGDEAKEWSRLEFGRELWNRGQNYNEKARKLKSSRRQVVKSPDKEHHEVNSNALDVDEIEADEDVDGDWRPSRRS